MLYFCLVKAFIHDPGMYDIEIKKGQTFRYDIWFGGEPPPAVTWERHDGVINPENDDRITMELFAKRSVYCQKNTVLTVKKVKTSLNLPDLVFRLCKHLPDSKHSCIQFYILVFNSTF